MNRIDKYLQASLGQNASDLHFISGDPVRARVHGGLQAIMEERLTVDVVQEAMSEIMDGTTKKAFDANDAADFAYEIEDVSRFRVNVFRHLNGIGAVFRAIPSKAMSLDELNMPDVLRTLCRHTQGMILVTGMAAMIDEMNRRMKGHIITIEDPIEFVHTAKGCLISQRENGVHSPGFAEELRSGLREDPDVILIGEMRDLETISIAVTAAEMGILVMGTLHTNGAAQTVDRIINSFPADKQSHIRTMISTSLRGVVSQQLLPTCNRPGRAAALEIMINTPAVSNLIRQGKLDQLETAIQSGGRVGMKTMDNALMELVDKGWVSGADAYQQANNKHMFEKLKDSN